MSHLSDIRARLDAATPGPWFPMIEDDREAWVATETFAVIGRPEPGEPMGVLDADADFIAHAPEDLRLLLDIAEAAQKVDRDGRGQWDTRTQTLLALRAALARLDGNTDT